MTGLIVILLTVAFFTEAVNGTDTCNEPFEIKTQNLNKHLIGHTLIELSVLDHHACARECMSLKVCKSIDYHIKDKTCKLNDVDSSSVDETEFEMKGGAIFSDISEWPRTLVGKCGPRPCTDKQKCVSNEEKYTCHDVDIGLPEIMNGEAVLQQPFTHGAGDKATVTCELGYYLTADPTLVRHTGKWEDVPTCTRASDCSEILNRKPSAKSGSYDVKLFESGKIITVYCDMDTEGGGWTVFQNRFDGSVDFYQTFEKYENGFGDMKGEFWLGLQYIQEMLNQGASELRIDVLTADDRAAYVKYKDFSLTEGNLYTLQIGNLTGSSTGIGDPLKPEAGKAFSTKDRDMDGTESIHCAATYQGAWWFRYCAYLNLNGRYEVPGTKSSVYYGNGGMIFRDVDGYKSLKKSKMMFKRE